MLIRNYSFKCLFILLSLFSAAHAQTTAEATAKISGDKTLKAEDITDAETLAVDFKNFTFPNFSIKGKKDFTLVGGAFGYANAKKSEFINYNLRKVYYFDVTGDRKTEAVVHILAATCQDCPPQSVFYLYSAEKKQPLEVWKIAAGATDDCGLKEIRFDKAEIVLEVFGDCAVKDWLIARDAASKKKDVLTRFVFSRENGEFSQTVRETLPFPANDIPTHRVQLKFGGEN